MKKSFATVGVGTHDERRIPIKEFLIVNSKDGRTTEIVELENDEGFLIVLKNTIESGRNTHQEIWVGKKSMSLLIYSLITILDNIDFDINENISKIIENNELDIKGSINLINKMNGKKR